MRSIIGAPARLDQFYKRSDIRKQILDAILNGENLLLSAPRRVGKTSILYDLIDNPDESIFAVYVNTEAVEDPERFFQVLLKAILNADLIEGFGKFSKGAKDMLTHWGNKIGGIKIEVLGVDIHKDIEVSFYDQLTQFLTDIKLDGKTILLLVDEFPITIEHIQTKQGTDGALKFLNQNRALRQTPEFQQKIKFVYTGSIGLFTAVKKIGGTDRVNDLSELKVNALKRDEAIALTNALLNQKIGKPADAPAMDYILKKLEWWIPFYFQLLVKEIADIVNYEGKEINSELIDNAFIKVAENGNIYFEHFKSRLAKSLKDDELTFALKLLLALKKQPVAYDDVINMAVGLQVQDKTDDILEILRHDGYVIEENKQYKFYSPILKTWWK